MAKSFKRSGGQASRVTGIAEIDARLNLLSSKSARAITRSSTNAGMSAFARVVRTQVSAESGISSDLKRALKRTIGKRFKRRRGEDAMEAKVGLGVGKKNKPVRSDKNKGGKGVAKSNVHWFALGTKVRTTKRGRDTGRITKLRIMQRAYAPGVAASRTAMIRIAKVKLDAEVKAGRKAI